MSEKKEHKEHKETVFGVIKTAFKPLFEKGYNEGIKDLKKSENLPLVIMVIAGLSAIVVSFVTLTAYLFRQYLNQYINLTLIWAAFGVSLLMLFPAITNARHKDNKRQQISNMLFAFYFVSNYILILLFATFYEFTDVTRFTLLILNTAFAFIVSFIRKIRNLGLISYFVAVFLPIYFFDLDISFYLPYWLIITLTFLLFAEYVGNSKLNILIATVTFVLYFFLLNKHVSAENKFFFLSFVFLFAYLYLFFDFIVYKAKQSKVLTKQTFSLLDYSVILIIQVFVITSVFIFFSNSAIYIALVFLLNSLPYGISFAGLRHKFGKEANTIIATLAVFYVLLAVSVFFHGDLTTLILIFGILITLVTNAGFVKDWKKIRTITYFGITATVFYMFTGLWHIVGFWGIKLLHIGFYKFLYIQILATALLIVMVRHKNQIIANEKTFYAVVKTFVTLWPAVLYCIITIYLVSFDWLMVSLSLPFYLLYYFGRMQKSFILEFLAYIGMFILFFLSLNIAYYGLIESWTQTLYSLGFYHLLFVGFMLVVLRYLIHLIDSSQDFEQKLKYNIKTNVNVYNLDNKTRSGIVISVIDYILQIWFIFLLLLFIKYYTGFWFSFIALVPAFILISWANIYHKNFSKYLGYFIYGMVAFKIFTYSFATQTGVSLFNILQVGFFIFLIWFTRINMFYFNRKVSLSTSHVKLDNATPIEKEIKGTFDRIQLFITTLKNLKFELKEVRDNEKWRKRRVNNLFFLFISIWFSVFMFFLGFYIPGAEPGHHYGYNMAFFSLFGLLFLAGKLENTTIENIALINGAVMFIGLFASFIESEYSFHFSAQPLYGKILMAQTYFTLLVLLPFYNYVVEFSLKDEIMHFLNRLAILLIPLIVFYIGYRKFDFFVRFFPWISLAVSILLSEIYKMRLLIIQSFFWLLVASVFVFIFPIPSVTLAGLLVLIPYSFYKKGHIGFIQEYPKYELLPAFTVLYSIFAVFRVYLLIESDFSGGFFLASSFIFTLLFFQNHIFPVKRMNTTLYYMGVGLILVGFFFFHQDTNFAYNFRTSSYRLFSVIFMPFSLMIMHKLLFNPKAYPGFSFITELFVVNIYYIITYSLLIYYFTSDITHILITLALFVHGISILFRSVVPRFRMLVFVALIVFGIGVLKIFLVDIKDFSIVAKLSLFMLVGGLFFAGAIFYNKKRIKLLEQETEKEKKNSKSATAV